MLLNLTWTETKNQIVDIKMALALVQELNKRGCNNVHFTVKNE